MVGIEVCLWVDAEVRRTNEGIKTEQARYVGAPFDVAVAESLLLFARAKRRPRPGRGRGKIRRGRLEGSPNRWLLGRRSVLLRPFWPIRRVAATKSTTSSNHIYSTFIIYQLFSFVKRNIVSQPLPVPPVVFYNGGNNRTLQPFRISCGSQPNYQVNVFPVH